MTGDFDPIIRNSCHCMQEGEKCKWCSVGRAFKREPIKFTWPPEWANHEDKTSLPIAASSVPTGVFK